MSVPRKHYNEAILTARAPAKLIISGEHAVLYGQPALAMAVNRYTTTTTSWRDTQSIQFKFADLEYAKTHTLKTLQRLRQQLQQDYNAFLKGHCSIRDVLKRPFELLQYSVSTLIERLNLQLPKGVEIAVDSDIPLGCGMGSSAAAIVSSLCALTSFLKLNWQRVELLNSSREIENLQHGKSSGLDIHLATYGGCVHFHDGVTQQRVPPNMQLYIVNTGKPEATTGECVSQVAEILTRDLGLASEFGKVTTAVDAAIALNDIQALQLAIQENHKLLDRIGVVPAKVKNLISDLQQNGIAAKICGAGSVSGDRAGVVLIVAEHDPIEIVNKHGYALQTIQVDNHGTQIL